MNVMTRTRIDLAATGVDLGRLRIAVELAARSVPPLWPLDAAIAVNPLAGFETLPFEEAVRAGSARFNARAALPLDQWRRLSAAGKPPRTAVRAAAIAQLGGIEGAFRLLGPDVSLIDCLMARLFDLPAPAAPRPAPDPVADAVADLCAAFFDAGTAGVPIAGRARGLFAATRDLLRHRPDMRAAKVPLPICPIGRSSRWRRWSRCTALARVRLTISWPKPSRGCPAGRAICGGEPNTPNLR